jgi:molybdopterin molybdotransferase
MSAMDGYAVRAGDCVNIPATLTVIGTAAAGAPAGVEVGSGQAVRIFTGAALPAGADTVVIQEDTARNGDTVTINTRDVAPDRHIRQAGSDFDTGQTLLAAGTRLEARQLGLAAAMNYGEVPVFRRPVVAILATGDELVPAGTAEGPDRLPASSGPMLAAMIAAAGGEPRDLGIAGDDADAVRQAIAGAVEADLLVTTGGASVGEHDVMREVLHDTGFEVDFWRIRMRPGKPLLFGRRQPDGPPILGLPGNPVSTFVCATLFVQPAVRRLAGARSLFAPRITATLAAALPANGPRESYLRTHLSWPADAERPLADPDLVQDSAMLRVLAQAQGLIVRAPDAEELPAGTPVSVLVISELDEFLPTT